MAELQPMPARSLEAHPDLLLAAVYEREVPAPIDSVWENVFDWAHLPWLHAAAFRSIALRCEGDWGWHADLVLAAGPETEIELVVDRSRSCYVARTRSGAGAPGEIWTHLTPLEVNGTGVRVEFRVAPVEASTLAMIGEGYRSLYQGLWDEDEGMIVSRREALLARMQRRADGAPGMDREEVDLGPVDALRSELPLTLEVGGHRFRIVERGEALYAHSLECPHWLGPLDGCDAHASELVCPWHGYRFDLETGRSVDGRGLRLRAAPRVQVDEETGHVRLKSNPAD
jgi:nitrite reductase/ring-hydroxylating ferredoxin subunit